MKQEKLSIRPYARLLTMLGDQLIRNERVALVELIKNSYDADADWVEVRFEDFNDDMSANECSRIVIEDNGNGMKPDEIRRSWMNPATPHKYLKKKHKKNKTPVKKRIMQGEKGIGRFAIFKLGKAVSVTTRYNSSSFESVIQYDFHNFDDDFISEFGKEKEIFLDEIQATYLRQIPAEVIKSDHGTLIEISQVKGNWSDNLINVLCRDISSLTDPLSRVTGRTTTDNFKISIVCNGKARPVEDDSAEDLKGLIEDKPVLKIQGEFNAQKKIFSFMENEDNSSKIEVGLIDPKIKGLWIWKQRFGDGKDDKKSREYECGNFKFHFYIFDFFRGISSKYELNQSQKNILKKHRVYLYRDEIRVYPYGDPDDDWLNMDVFRGTGKVGDFFSNDQVVGWIDISQEDNPNLRDKTNREGLIEQGNAVGDFVGVIQVILSYIRQYPYSRYQQSERERNVAEAVRSDLVAKRLAELKASLERRKYKAGVRDIAKIEKEYKREKDYLIQRAEITEDLAGVGLSVEMTSHDIMLMMSRAKDISKEIARLSRNSDDEKIQQQADMLVGVLSQITDGMQDIQSLFKSAKRRKKALRIEPILDRIFQLYESLLNQRDIQYEKIVSPGSPLVADTTDGVIMQVLINLFDNASYWLDTVNREDKKICVSVNGTQGELIFSDNGPGIDEEDLPYIFEPFYSGKGQEGRGLGLYIARQLLERHDYRISVTEAHQKKLPGANFVVSFVREDS